MHRAPSTLHAPSLAPPHPDSAHCCNRNKPNAKGELACNGERQASVLRAAGDAAGAVLLVPRGSTHHSYDDVLLFFGGTFKPLLQAVSG